MCSSMVLGFPRRGPGAQDVYTSLLEYTVWHVVVEPVFGLEKNPSFVGIAEDGFGTSFARQMPLQRSRRIGHHPSCIAISYGRDVFVSVRENFGV